MIETLECVMMAATNQSSSYKLEIDFLEENLENCSVENRYFSGYFDGKRDEFEDMLERFLLISSTFFIKRSALDSIHQNHLGREGLRWNI